jgi:Asp-tRNA(Asn)/Glu-tRNA(Gln) amidotransferase A subunit family amidase
MVKMLNLPENPPITPLGKGARGDFGLSVRSIPKDSRHHVYLLGVFNIKNDFVRAFNLNGWPAISVPCGFTNQELPIGLQLAGAPFAEETVLQAAYAYEEANPLYEQHPPI